jgi:tight adherence protein C
MVLSAKYFPILVAASFFLSIFLIYIGLFSYLSRRKKKHELAGRIRKAEQEKEAVQRLHSTPKGRNKLVIGLSQIMSSFGKRAAPKKYTDFLHMRIKFLRAGIRHQNAAAIFWSAKILLALLLPACVWLVPSATIKLLNFQLTIALCIYFVIFGFYLPEIWLRIKTARRREKLTTGFPDALDLLIVCVEAGMGMDAAINRVAREIRLSNKELSEELKLMGLELRAGKSRRDALKNLAMRTNLEDVNSLATLLIQTDRFGGSIAQALRVYSDTFRTKRYQKAEEKAAKIPVKLVFPLILFIFPSLITALAGPAAVQVYQYFLNK